MPHRKELVAFFMLLVFFSGYFSGRKRTKNKADTQMKLHMCNYRMIPHVTPSLESLQYLSMTNKSWARICDGEIDQIVGRKHRFNSYNPSLAAALLTVLHSHLPNLAIGIPNLFHPPLPFNPDFSRFWHTHDFYRQWLLENVIPDKQYLDSFATCMYVRQIRTYCQPYREAYSIVRQIWNGKHVVLLQGNMTERFTYDLFDNADRQTIIKGPPSQAWDVYDQLLEQLLSQDPEAIFILSLGPVATVLTYDLAKAGRRALDLGHMPRDYDYAMQQRTILDNFHR